MQPTLNLNFAKTKQLDPRIDFTRASSGTYFDANGVLKLASTNQPRFDHNPLAGESLGLLIEDARTNLLTYSEQLDHANWLKTRSSGSANSTSAPDGVVSADKLVEDATATNSHFIQQNYTPAATTTYTFSAFVKAAERSTLLLAIGAGLNGTQQSFAFDLAAASATLFQGTATGFITNVGGGYYRCSITATSGAAPSETSFNIYLSNGGTNTIYTGDGTSGLHLWGAQLEVGAFASSYIPTTAASATRSADIANMSGVNFSSWYRQDEGSFALSATPHNLIGTSDATSRVYFGVGDPAFAFGAAETIYMTRGASSSVFSASVLDGGVTQVTGVSASITTQPFKTALTYKINDTAASVNGAAATSDTTCTMPTPTTMSIGSSYNMWTSAGAANAIFGHIASLKYFPKRLTNAELQGLSL